MIEARWAIRIADDLRRAGHALDGLLKEVGLVRADLASPEDRIPYAAYVGLIERAAMLLADPGYGLKLGASHDVRDNGLLGFLALNSPTLKDALAKKPNDPEIIGFMVGVYQEKKDYPAAIDLARKMVAADPKNDKFHFTLGAALDQNKQRDEGMAEMKKAIELNPANAQALNYLGYSYAEQGTNLVEAEKLIKRALDIEPEDGFYVDSLGWVYYQKGDYKKAVEQLEKAVNLTGSDPTITEHLGDAYRKLGKVKEASHEYSDALQKSQETDQVARLKDKIQVLQNAASAGH